VFENRVLRRIFGLKRNEVSGDWRKLHNKEIQSLYCLITIGVNKSRRIGWAFFIMKNCVAYAVHLVLLG
jgi:hypothetical protein